MEMIATILWGAIAARVDGAEALLHRDQAPHPTAISLPGQWEYTTPLIAPEKRDGDISVARKDPTVVFHEGRWHVFMTVKLPRRTAIEYCAFERWEDADKAPRTVPRISESGYYG
jgi:hypothetical protein